MESPPSSPWIRNDSAPSLSLSMIIKNEIATLERCLRGARPHVDEIVVVDTGSTDGSRDVARKYADVFDEIEWPDSFSEARNHSFDLASGDYIMYLDGDEYIPNPFHWQIIHEALAHPDIVLVQLRLRNLLPENSLIESSTIWHERIMLNHPEIRWEGRVHNQIRRSVMRHIRRTDMRVVQAPAEIIHVGYALPTDKQQEKYSVRIPLLREEYENPTSAVTRAYYGYQLGLVYLLMGNNEKAYNTLHNLDYELLSTQNGFYAHYLAAKAAVTLNKLDTALQHCEGMLSLKKTEPVAYFTLAYVLLRAGQAYEGALTLIEAYRVNAREGHSARFTLNEEHLLKSIRQVFARARGTENALKAIRAYVEHEGKDEVTRKLTEVLTQSAAPH